MLISLFSIANLYAQNNVEGYVTDYSTNEPVASAFIKNLTNNETTITDLSGKFILANSQERDSLEISSMGYQSTIIVASTLVEVKLNTENFSLNEIILSGNKEEEKRIETPIAISTISATTISENKPTSIDQVLNQTPGVFMVDLGNEQHTMSIRQPIAYGANYLYLEDGIPIRASGIFNHNALLEINMANVKKVEVIRGPASSMYGSEAIGAAVNFISFQPSIKPTAGLSIQGNDLGYKRTDFYASNTLNKLGIRLAGYYGERERESGEHNGFDKLALSLSLKYKLSERTALVMDNAIIDYYADMKGSLDSTQFYDREYQSSHTFTNRDVQAFRSKLALKQFWNKSSKTSLTGYYRDNSIKQNPSYRVKDDYKPWIQAGNPNLAHGEVNDNSFVSYGLVGQHKQDYTWLNSSLIAGLSLDYSPNTYEAEYIRINKDDNGNYESFETVDSLLAKYTADLTNTAAYLQFKLSPFKDFILTTSMRYDHFVYDYDNALDSTAFSGAPDSRDVYSQLTPNLGFTYNPMDNFGFYGNYSRGFAPPQIGELYRGVKVPTIEPAIYDSYELGLWFAQNKKGKGELTGFVMNGQDEIISVQQNDGSTEKKNAGETRHMGIEAAYSYKFNKDLSARTSALYAHHEFIDYKESDERDYAGKDMFGAPNWIINAAISYKPSKLKGFRSSLEMQHISPYFTDQANEKEYVGYTVFNLRLGYELKSFEFWMNILNVTDKLYANVVRSTNWGDNYTTGNPRNINLGIGYKFN